MQFPASFMAEGLGYLIEQDGAKFLDWGQRFFASAASGVSPEGGDAPPATDTPQALRNVVATAASRKLSGR